MWRNFAKSGHTGYDGERKTKNVFKSNDSSSGSAIDTAATMSCGACK